MLKAILGPALGGLAAGAIALVASAQGRAPESAWPTAAPTATPFAMSVGETRSASAATNAPTLVQCEPQQEAVLRRNVVAGREVAEVTCMTRAGAPYMMTGYQPAQAQPVYTQSDIVSRPVVRTQAARPRTVYRNTSSRASVESRRSWKKTALVIGGSTAGGAGVGGIVGGKKGALIGAAIGGGAASIYEATKR